MLEIAPNSYVVKSKIIGLKVVTKEGKFWVVFNCGKTQEADLSVFSAPFPDEAQAKAFLNSCASNL